MKKEQQIIALAKLDGGELDQHFNGPIHVHFPGGKLVYLSELEYLTSRDAIWPLIQKLDDATQIKFWNELTAVLRLQHGYTSPADGLILATIPQLAEVLLRAKNIWKD